MRYITIALAKGRLADLSIDLLESIGIDCSELKSASRKLIFHDNKNMIRFILVKPSDVSTYVEYGAADIGISGKDPLLEDGRHLYEVLDLGFGQCEMVVAGPAELQGKLNKINNKRVATKYPHIAREYFETKKHESVEIIKLNGSVELAPLVGLSEVIVDIVQTGATLKENGLVILETIAPLSARLVVNKVSMKIESIRINKLIKDLEELLKKKK